MTNPRDSETQTTEEPSTVFEIIEDYVARLRRGEDPKLSEVLRGRSDLEGRFKEVLSTVLRLESFAGPDAVVAHRSLGHYEILQELGRGGQGVVYEAIDTRLGRRVAIKVLSSLGPGCEELLLRFRREAEVAARLKHPSLCTVYEAAVEGNIPFIAMELIEGESLRDRILRAREEARSRDASCTFLGKEKSESNLKAADRTASRSEPSHWSQIVAVLRLFESCARALHAMHEASVIHRDIKPGNIMVSEDERPIIMDFGLARIDDLSLSALTRTGDLFGTPEYMSPEQISGQAARLDRRTDVWSLGVSFFECLTLERPFQAETRQALSNLILVADPPSARKLNPSIPRDLEAVLDTALEKKADRRYQTALDLAEEIQRVRERKPVRARPVTRGVRLQRWAQRNPAVAVLLAGLLVVLLAGTVISIIFASEARSSAAEAMRERAGVFRLRAFHALEDLRRRADLDLWPLNPKHIPEVQERIQDYTDWLGDARALVSGLTESDSDTGAPSHYAQLAELRHRALPQSDAEKETDRNTHPRFEELEALEVKLRAWRRAEAVRAGREQPEDFAPDQEALPEDVLELIELARPLVHPGRRIFGREAEGLAISRLGAASAGGMEHLTVVETLAWALVANGLDERALDIIRRAIEGAPNRRRREAFEERLRDIEDSIASWFGDAGARRIQDLEAKISALEQVVSARRTFTFASEEDRWWHAQLERLVRELEEFSDPEEGLISGISVEHGWGIQRRLDHVRTLERRTVSDHALPWDDACARVRGNPRYSGLTLSPRLGLVPLGPDPDSTLEEFADTATGRTPERDAVTGRMVLTEETGLVFVLVPGGTFTMGAQRSDPDEPNHDPKAEPHEGPLDQVTLAPFFLSKYEMTQGQWKRATGANPSIFKPGWSVGGRRITWLHPVEQVSWNDCERTLTRLGMVLPTESQWEYACRAETTSPWWCERTELATAANLIDRSFHESSSFPSWDYEEWSDGHTVHAPVGALAPNGFGLHDMHGNLIEWCRDWYFDYGSVPVRLGDGLREMGGASSRVYRGGGWNGLAFHARSSHRNRDDPDNRSDTLGVRPVMNLDTR